MFSNHFFYLSITIFFVFVNVQPVNSCCKVRVGSPTVNLGYKSAGAQSSLGCFGCGPCNAFCCNCDRGCCRGKRSVDDLLTITKEKANALNRFQLVDLNNNKCIDYSEFSQFIQNAGIFMNATAKQMEFEKLDQNKNGQIEKHEMSDHLAL
jgi:hypothetical protein